jgi:gamma-glutamyltranspeptidase/glutathione hydrolase
MVSCSQPIASEIGMRILKQGGNCADAAIAIAAALNVTEPTSTGIGGDCFCLYYDSKDGSVKGLNGSGRAPSALTLERLHSMGFNETNPWSPFSALTVTVPGAAAGWCDTIENFGSGNLTLAQILEPAIQLAEQGFPVSQLTSRLWANGLAQLQQTENANELLLNGKAPNAGELMKNSTLANTFKLLAAHGKKGFYEGPVAQAIVDVVHSLGGLLTLEDLKAHESTIDTPISVNYRGVDIYELPPNGQGLTALLALNILNGFDISSYKYHSPEHLHLLVEALRLAFADTRWYVTDPKFSNIPIKELLSPEYAAERRKLFDASRSNPKIEHGYPGITKSSTVYFCVVDGTGSACSFINSNYMGFGTGIIPKGCGFTLQNRGHNFSLNPDHPNVVAPNKRPYHTIIPGMAVKDGKLFCPFGVMGGFMQPQGHVQVISNMIDFGMDPQQALDSPRFCIEGGDALGGTLLIEEGIDPEAVTTLQKLGHNHAVLVRGWNDRSVFGRGQIIRRDTVTGVLAAGCDPRSDGQAIGWC